MTRHSRLSRLDAEDRRRLTRCDIDSLVIALRDDVIIAGRLESVSRETRAIDSRDPHAFDSVDYTIDA